jgi:hypothetical protein
LIEFVESVEELFLIASKDNPEFAGHIFRRLEKPLRQLCFDAGVPELFERSRMLSSKRRRVLPRDLEPTVEVPKEATEG